MANEAHAYAAMKTFKFRLEINGFEAALVQEFSPGDRTHGVTMHAGAGQNHPTKEVGMLHYGNCTLRSIVPLNGPGREFIEEWANVCQDPATGNGQLPAMYRKNFTLYEETPDGGPARVWEYKRGFPVRVSLGQRSSLSDADVIEEMELAFDERHLRVV